MNINKLIDRVDAIQQRHRILAFPFAVIKKYGDDSGGYQAALLTYYGFLSVFPLFLVLITVLQLWFDNNPTVQHEISQSISHFFPMLGEQLQSNVQGISKSGWGLAIGLILTFYGARGVAEAMSYCYNNIWQVPRTRRPGFPKNQLQSLIIMLAMTVGFIASVAVSSFSSSLGRAFWVKVVANILGFMVITGVLMFISRRATARRVPLRYTWLGSCIAGIIIQLLLTFGSLILSNYLKGIDNLYGTFAVVIGMLFWIYLIAQVVIYSVEVDSVRFLRLYPRAINIEKPTKADEEAYEMYAKIENYSPRHKKDTRFKH